MVTRRDLAGPDEGGATLTVVLRGVSIGKCGTRAPCSSRRRPDEYTFAKEHLRQAQVEAAEASYSDAAGYAETAELYAQKAIEHVQSAKKAGK